MVKTNDTYIEVTVKTIPHPDPQRLIDMWSRIVLKEILDREREGIFSTSEKGALY
ncbi:hypothetical protein D3C74_227530 [compost metagenome]